MVANKSKLGFTLIELLVVIAVIAIMASLLLPVLFHAKATARQIQCFGNQRQLSLTWMLYSDDYNAFAPNGYATPQSLNGGKMWVVGGTHMDRPLHTNVDMLINPRYAAFAPYLPNPKVYKCPSDHKPTFFRGVEYRGLRSYSLNGYIAWRYPSAKSTSPDYISFAKPAHLSTLSPNGLCTFLDVNSDNICFAAFVTLMGDDGRFFHFPGTYHNGSGTVSYADGHVESHKYEDPRTLQFANIYHTEQYRADRDLTWLQERATISVKVAERRRRLRMMSENVKP